MIASVDSEAIARLLERTRERLSPEDQALVTELCASLIAMQRLVRERGTTIARLRRLVGTASSERSAVVLGSGKGGDEHVAGQSSEPTGGEDEPEKESDSGGNGPTTGKEQSPAAEEREKARGHGRVKAADYPDAEHVAVGHEHLRPKDDCPACDRGSLYRLAEPARFLRIIGQAPLCAVCWDCERLRCSACGKVFTARPPPAAQGPKHSETAASMMALLRYGIGLPLNRLARLEGYLSTPLPPSTQWQVALERVEDIRPAYKELVRLAAQGSVVHNDDTFVRILAFMGKRRVELLRQGKLEDPDRTGLFTTAIVSIRDTQPIAIFATGRKHAGENLTRLLDERAAGMKPPLLMSDALERNLPKGHKVDWANCLAHGRRGIVDEVENFPSECTHILEELGRVFAVEARSRRQRLTDDERLRLHQEVSGPVMTELETWLEALAGEKRIEPNSGMGQAITYLLKRWDRLTRFLSVAGAPLENNICERALKMAIRHRNASLFYKTERGATVGDIYMTLIHTAALHGENPFHYLTALQVNARAVAQSPADWLPWTYRETLARRGPCGASGEAEMPPAESPLH